MSLNAYFVCQEWNSQHTKGDGAALTVTSHMLYLRGVCLVSKLERHQL